MSLLESFLRASLSCNQSSIVKLSGLLNENSRLKSAIRRHEEETKMLERVEEILGPRSPKVKEDIDQELWNARL